MDYDDVRREADAGRIKTSSIPPQEFIENLCDSKSQSILPPDSCQAVFIDTDSKGVKTAEFIYDAGQGLKVVTCEVTKPQLDTMLARIGAVSREGGALDTMSKFALTRIGSRYPETQITLLS